MSICNLDALFTPGAIALIGASNQPGSIGDVLAANLFGAGCHHVHDRSSIDDIRLRCFAPLREMTLRGAASAFRLMTEILDYARPHGIKACMATCCARTPPCCAWPRSSASARRARPIPWSCASR